MRAAIDLRTAEWKGGFKNLVQNWEKNNAQLSYDPEDQAAFGKSLRKSQMQSTHVARDLASMRNGKKDGDDALSVKVGVFEGGRGGKIRLGAKTSNAMLVLLGFKGQLIDTRALLAGEEEVEAEEV